MQQKSGGAAACTVRAVHKWRHKKGQYDAKLLKDGGDHVKVGMDILSFLQAKNADNFVQPLLVAAAARSVQQHDVIQAVCSLPQILAQAPQHIGSGVFQSTFGYTHTRWCIQSHSRQHALLSKLPNKTLRRKVLGFSFLPDLNRHNFVPFLSLALNELFSSRQPRTFGRVDTRTYTRKHTSKIYR